jgi:hypothetical protein
MNGRCNASTVYQTTRCHIAEGSCFIQWSYPHYLGGEGLEWIAVAAVVIQSRCDGRACGVHGKFEKCMQNFDTETRKTGNVGGLHIARKVISKWL